MIQNCTNTLTQKMGRQDFICIFMSIPGLHRLLALCSPPIMQATLKTFIGKFSSQSFAIQVFWYTNRFFQMSLNKFMLCDYIQQTKCCVWFRHKILRIGPKGLCGAHRAPVPAEGWYPSMSRPQAGFYASVTKGYYELLQINKFTTSYSLTIYPGCSFEEYLVLY